MLLAAPGFNSRLRTAMLSQGLDDADSLAAAIRISIPHAKALMASSEPPIDALMLYRLEATTGYDGKWLATGVGLPAARISVDPEEGRLLQLLRAATADRRDAVYDSILGILNA